MSHVDLEAALLGSVVAGRECGACTACCDILKIDSPELQKPAGVLCAHCSSKGCNIHADRPEVCKTWFCGWRRHAALADTARPDLSSLMVSLDIVHEPRNCLEGVAIVVRSLNRREAFESQVAEDILDALCDRLVPIWLHDGAQKILVHPDSEIAHFVITGKKPPVHLQEIVIAWRSRYEMFAS